MSRELVTSVSIKDCEVQTFRAGGNGGQNQDKRESGVRVIHHPSGARGESREERKQLQNKKNAFRRMTETKEFCEWARRQAGPSVNVERTDERVRTYSFAKRYVKDHRTGKKTTEVERVLNGELDLIR